MAEKATEFLQLKGSVARLEEQDTDVSSPELARYRVQLTGAGKIPRGIDWSLEVPISTLKRDYRKFNKVGAYVHAQGEHVPEFMRSLQDKVGFFRNASWNEATKTIDADLVLSKTDKAKAFQNQLDLDLDNNNAMVQFSAVYAYDFSERETKKQGNTHYIVTVDKIRKVYSVDAVDEGAFPMSPINKLVALSDWKGTLQKEDNMSKEVAQDEAVKNEQDTVTEQGTESAEMVALRAEHEELKRKQDASDAVLAKLQAALSEEADTADETETDKDATNDEMVALRAEVDAMKRAQLTAENERHFEQKIATLDASDPAIPKLREAVKFDETDTAGIDTIVDPVIASLTAEGRANMKPGLSVKVTGDQADTVDHLMTAALTQADVKVGDKNYEVMDIERIVKEQFGDVEAAYNPQKFWDTLQLAHARMAMTDAEIDAAVTSGRVQLNTPDATTTSDWGETLGAKIPRVAMMLYNGDRLTQWLQTIIPNRNRYSVPDFQDRYLRYTGTFGQLLTVAENQQVMDINVSESFRVPLKPVKKQGKFRLTYEQVLNSPTAAIRSLVEAMATSTASTDFQEVMDKLFGIGGAGFAPKSQGYESGTLDTGADFLSTTNGNYASGAQGANNAPPHFAFSYATLVAAIDMINAQTAYGEDNFSLAGMVDPQIIFCPPANYRAASAMVRATLQPGSQNNDVNEIMGMTVIPVSKTTASSTNQAKLTGVMVNPAQVPAVIMSRLNGQPPQFQPNALRDDNASFNRITYKSSHIRTFTLVDRRAIAVRRNTA